MSASPDDDSAVLGLAAALRGQGSREKRDSYLEAEKLLKELREKRPKQLAATFNLAVLYADFLGKPAEAKTLFDEFLRDAPETHPARPVAQKWLSQQKGAPPQKAAPAPAKGVK
jgi:cytochrome c-type biogenesis protein CcmH/NrfG